MELHSIVSRAMNSGWQLPRNALAWLLLAQFAVILPHIERLPMWVSGSYLLCALWRIMVFQGRWSFAARSMKVFLMLASVAGIFLSYRTLLGLEPSVALMMVAFSLKLIEAASRRDYYLLVFLSYFAVLTEFLFDQSLFMSLAMFAAVLLITAALLALHSPAATARQQRWSLAPLKRSGLIFAQALPLMLLLFLVFPRLDPLWQVPLPSHQAQTGVSDSLAAGDLSSLARSDALAFRVRFDGELPPPEKLYWRGVVMSTFDGRRWSRSEQAQLSGATARTRPAGGGEGLRQWHYTVTQEPTYQPWLFALQQPFASSSSDTRHKILHTGDFRLRYSGDVYERIAYSVVSYPDLAVAKDASRRQLAVDTRLPVAGNPRAQAFAKRLYQESRDPADFVARVMAMYRQQPFVYTIEPPLLGRDNIDEFLFDSRRGFCGHYASSFAFLMRAAGIPARVVGGYLGGEINPLNGTVLVHQFDAHAWAEVWLPGQGWLQLDPTAQVAPERVESSIQDALASESPLAAAGLSPIRYRHIRWVNTLRLRLDALEYAWASAVIQYRGERQLDFLQGVLGAVTPQRLIALFLLVGTLVTLWVMKDLLRQRPRVSPEQKVYDRLCRKLAARQLGRGRCEAPIDFARRIGDQLELLPRQHFLAASRLFVSICYEPIDDPRRQQLLKQLRREVRCFTKAF